MKQAGEVRKWKTLLRNMVTYLTGLGVKSFSNKQISEILIWLNIYNKYISVAEICYSLPYLAKIPVNVLFLINGGQVVHGTMDKMIFFEGLDRVILNKTHN